MPNRRSLKIVNLCLAVNENDPPEAQYPQNEELEPENDPPEAQSPQNEELEPADSNFFPQASTSFLQNEVFEPTNSNLALLENTSLILSRSSSMNRSTCSATTISVDTETFDTSSDSEVSDSGIIQPIVSEGHQHESDVFYGDMNIGTRRRRKADKKLWKKNLNKRLRMEGKPYLGYSRPRGGKMKQNKHREERLMGSRCDSEFCRKSHMRNCADITEENRACIFNKFWNDMNWDQRKIFVANHVSCKVKKKCTVQNESRRKGTFEYSLTVTDSSGVNSTKKVCKQMFLNTLNIGSFSVRSWAKSSQYGMHEHQEIRESHRTRSIDSARVERLAVLHQFFYSLPKMPSHYNRQNTNKIFLEPIYESITNLYKIYKSFCETHSHNPYSMKIFHNMFKEKNLAIHQLKKDMCDQCEGYKTGNITEADYQAHLIKKDNARAEKDRDKLEATEGKCIVLTVDL